MTYVAGRTRCPRGSQWPAGRHLPIPDLVQQYMGQSKLKRQIIADEFQLLYVLKRMHMVSLVTKIAFIK